MAQRRQILISSARTRPRTGSDPTPYAASRGRKVANGRDAKLVHDIGIGQPCLRCGRDCEGMMLHMWRKKCINCQCPPDAHKMEQDPHASLPFLENLSLGNGSLEESIGERVLRKYTWHPQGISAKMVEQYMACLPEDCVPLKGSKGEPERLHRFYRQLPPYDFSPEACHKLSDHETKRLIRFTEKRVSKAYSVGTVEVDTARRRTCAVCSEQIPAGSVCVTAERASSERVWHPQCFQCTTCKEILVDLIYFVAPEQDNGIYCGRHHADLVVPRCAGCDEIILEATYTKAQGKAWHKEHFCCSDCDSCLTGRRYAPLGDKLACERCFNTKYALKCQKCREPIGIGAKKLTHKGKAWHEECFVCKRCKEDLRDLHYYLLDGELHCSECMQPIGQCFGCKSAISPTVSYLQHKSRCWHAECFKCNTCHAWLVDGQFHELQNNLVCNSCYVDMVGKRCEVCGEAVIGRGVQFCSRVFHPECFTCTDCGEVLETENSRVKEKKKMPYCLECFLKTAKKCFKCQQPITTTHTMYEGSPYHVECFTCSKCGAVIGSQEYYETTHKEILCAECGK